MVQAQGNEYTIIARLILCLGTDFKFGYRILKHFRPLNWLESKWLPLFFSSLLAFMQQPWLFGLKSIRHGRIDPCYNLIRCDHLGPTSRLMYAGVIWFLFLIKPLHGIGMCFGEDQRANHKDWEDLCMQLRSQRMCTFNNHN